MRTCSDNWQVKSLKSCLATQFTMYHDCSDDFSEFLLRVSDMSESRFNILNIRQSSLWFWCLWFWCLWFWCLWFWCLWFRCLWFRYLCLLHVLSMNQSCHVSDIKFCFKSPIWLSQVSNLNGSRLKVPNTSGSSVCYKFLLCVSDMSESSL